MKRSALSIIIFIAIIGIIAVQKNVPKTKDHRELNVIGKLYTAGRLQNALEKMKVYLKKYPKDNIAWTIQGNILSDLGKDKESENSHQKALQLNPKNYQSLVALGVISRRKNLYDKAMEYYHKALKIKPTYGHAYTSIAVIEMKRKHDKKALEYALKAYKYDQSNAIIAANLALAYHYNKDYKNRDHYTKIAQKLGYKGISRLYMLYQEKLTIRD